MVKDILQALAKLETSEVRRAHQDASETATHSENILRGGERSVQSQGTQKAFPTSKVDMHEMTEGPYTDGGPQHHRMFEEYSSCTSTAQSLAAADVGNERWFIKMLFYVDEKFWR